MDTFNPEAFATALNSLDRLCARRLSEKLWKVCTVIPPHFGREGPQRATMLWLWALGTWSSKMVKIMDPVPPILSILGYRAIVLGSFGGPGRTI